MVEHAGRKADLMDTVPLEEPLAELERHLISAYVAGAGEDLHGLYMRTDAPARHLLADASRYASAKRSQSEASFLSLHTRHGDSSGHT